MAATNSTLSDLTAECVRSILDYDPFTGILRWKAKAGTDRETRRWNTRYAGKVVGSSNGGGHRCIQIAGRKYKEHRVAWLWHRGGWPAPILDHRSGRGSENAITNLRPATRRQNAINHKPYRKASGLPQGVRKHHHRYVSRITIDGKLTHLGTFSTVDEAAQAYQDAAQRHFGQFARPEHWHDGTIEEVLSRESITVKAREDADGVASTVQRFRRLG